MPETAAVVKGGHKIMSHSKRLITGCQTMAF